MGKFLNRHFKSGLVPEWVIQKLLKAPDKEKASIELIADTVNSLKDICQGVHIITIGAEDKLGQYLNAAKLR
jgi:methylenetetrahydrofolate reductase (NADPH)